VLFNARQVDGGEVSRCESERRLGSAADEELVSVPSLARGRVCQLPYGSDQLAQVARDPQGVPWLP